MQSIQHVTLDNGLHLITEHVPDVRTAALEWLVPAGVATNEHDGDSVLLTELMFRGAGGLSDKEHTQAVRHAWNSPRHHLRCTPSYVACTIARI